MGCCWRSILLETWTSDEPSPIQLILPTVSMLMTPYSVPLKVIDMLFCQPCCSK